MEKVLLKNHGKADSHKIANYIANGGYKALAAALKLRPDNIIQMVKDSGMRGRGGAGFSTGLKWSFIPKDPTLQKYLCCNADEGEPGTFKDRGIMDHDPHLLVEGMMISSYAIGATVSYIYIRGEFVYGARRLEEAIQEAYAKGYLGKNIMGSGFDHDMYVHRGYGAYICGEETALLESIEGYRAQPRKKPPFPALAGLYGKPTVINNVETLACIPAIIEKGPEWFSRMGPEKSPGPKIFGVSGHVKRPGLYELPMGTTARDLIYNHCGGMLREDRPIKAFIPGGVSAPMLLPADLDTPLDFDSLAAKGTMLGSGAVIVMDTSTCMVKTAYIINRFFSHESCGKCTPCRDGTPWLTKVLRRIEHGEGRAGDVDLLESLCGNIFGRTFCPLGDGAVMALRGALKHFRNEFEYHIEHKRCMAS
ncbi:MAG TPA: NADH-quinone oxidoreductase subunit F [Deltaproteobacteria bacterium]|nr:MAG: NADH oxidoreductase (quinone) subunit F [Deltaproteobacteria bacterium GWA2_55_82]OGQ64178.1 MAG: NADH oxidoreductase (quinone) subunit F [Deltaproteobacteria bacterium RIFCSPLOWO2_02_FULL_55_12]OIJ74632.1 MAG: NADH oxidoreductase (quinone) subunit F [Deltaproteobacteria bacterium GWC2_55_46]HBG46422.1 NADH-quinone oxidoreductase subunit F [Deltaproteobacteria bacterium]HCY10634.1 NADH-quinone oxidoreductase subunit F [Deltaproteobacteria bacterium]